MSRLTLAIESTDPRLPIDKNESWNHRDHFEFELATAHSLPQIRLEDVAKVIPAVGGGNRGWFGLRLPLLGSRGDAEADRAAHRR